MTKTPDCQKRASETYRQRMRALGFVPVSLWIPTDQVETIRQVAVVLRDGGSVATSPPAEVQNYIEEEG